MDSYIVRIYRREATKRRALVGVVERVGTDARRAFNDRDELWRILTTGKKRQRSRPPRGTPDTTWGA